MLERFKSFIAECPVVAIARGISPSEILDVCNIMYKAGVRLFEVPLNTPDALESIAMASEKYSGKMMIGAGTVLSPEEVVAVYRAGGTFIISPNTDLDVIRESKRLGLISIPGFFTASEAFAAQKAGADFLKLFPAILGPAYVKDLKAVVKTPILAVGGVNKENIPEFLKVCLGVGVGSALYKTGKSLDAIANDAQDIVKLSK